MLNQYKNILARDPQNFDALQGAWALFLEAGSFQEAERLFAQACDMEPSNFIAHFYHGLALQNLKCYDEALASYDRALSLKADLAGAHNNRGNVLREMQRYDESLASYDKALSLRTEFAEAHSNRGNVLKDLQRYDDALASYDRALSLKADYAEAHNNRGNVLREMQRYDEALSCYDKALSLKPDYAEAHNNRGNVLREMQHYDEALSSYDKALSLKPDYAEAHNNRGNVLSEMQRYDEALSCYDKALSLKRDYAEAHNNRGVVLKDLRRYDESLASYNRAIDLNPDFADALFYKGLLLLLLGKYEEGWRLHEWRWKTNLLKGVSKSFGQPVWLGTESLSGKTILLHEELGWGDIIQFVRYVPLVEALGASVILQVSVPLVSLFRTLPGNFNLVSNDDVLPPFDLRCPIMSLPLAFQTTLKTIPAPPAYLSADAARSQRWAQRLGGYDGLKVGVVWAGRQAMPADRRRSLPLSSFSVLRDVPGVQFFSLQIGPASAQLAELRQRNWDGPEIADFTGDIHEWADTAALVENLDLVISCDTATAHLAAAMGKPTWILNRYDTCWRWLTEREDSPWYPSVRLFRQSQPGDWNPVLSRVKAELVRLATALRSHGVSWNRLGTTTFHK